MDEHLPPDWLAAALSLTPSLRECHPDWVADRFSGEELKASQADAQLIIDALKSHRSFVADAALTRLAECDFTFVPRSLFSAHAALYKGREVIVLFEGLIVVMQIALEMSYAIAHLPDDLDEVYPQPDYPTVSALGWAAVLFVRLVHGYAARGEPAPNFASLCSSNLNKELYFGLLGGLWITVLHELGHHALGHVSAKRPVSKAESDDDLFVAELLTRYQRCEIEADRYAYDALTEDGRALHMSWMNTALGAQMLFDSLLTTRTDTHPLSVNRLSRFLNQYTPTPAGVDPKSMTDHLKRHARLFRKTEQEHLRLSAMNTAPLIAGLDRHQVVGMIESLAPTFAAFDVDLMVLFAPVSSWRDRLVPS